MRAWRSSRWRSPAKNILAQPVLREELLEAVGVELWARTGLGKVGFHQGQYEMARSQFRQVLEETACSSRPPTGRC